MKIGSWFSWNWRLCLQTSGIYRDSAIPCGVGKGKSRSGALRAAPAHGLAPLVGARVASLRCPTLRCGQPYFTTTIQPDKSLAN
jgi:hypothetical protein